MRLATKFAVGLAALGVPAALALTTPELGAQSTATLRGEAYGTYVNTLLTDRSKTPAAVLPAGGGMDAAAARLVSVPSVLELADVHAITTGAGDGHDASSQSSTTIESVEILGGLIKADLVVAMSSSSIHDVANSNADGSSFAGLVVNGIRLGSNVAPNTTIALPGVGKVILNEQRRVGDGVDSTGLEVNMIHVILTTGLFNTKIGEIVVGSAYSEVGR